ncbi:MAG TPA: hypothetical protein PKE29_04390 [Phycisphaerales bacterium]|nr:hypothetical protein [Phycisphaerales bacterium]
MWSALFDGQAAWFGIPAVLGTAVFALRLLMVLIGGHDTDFDHGALGDAHGDAGHSDSGDALRLLTLEGGAAFFMGLGWGGLGALKGADLSVGWSILTGFGCGAVLLLAQAAMMRAVHKLQASGNVSIVETVGLEGVVYVAVPAAGKGRGLVTLVVGGKQRQFNALSAGKEIPSQTRVVVDRANDDNTVTVRRAGSA